MASALIGALRVSLGLDSAEFQRGVKAASGQLSKLGADMQKIGAAVSVVGTGIALAVRSQIKAADNLTKLAQSIGVNVEALSQLQYAADLSGVSLDQLRTSLTILSRNLVDQADKFETVGVATRNAAGEMRPTVDVLHDLADVFASMPDGAEKTALAVELLGRSGAEMIPLFNGGSAALRGLMQEADRLGLTLDHETGRAAERFNDALSKLQAAATGLARQIASALAPAMARIAEAVAEAAAGFAKLSEPMQTFAAGLVAVVAAAGPVIFALGTITRAATALGAAATLALGPWGRLAALIVAAGVAALTFSDRAETVADPVEEARVALGLLNEVLGDFNTTSPEAASNSLEQAAAHARNAEAALKAAEAELEVLKVRQAAMTFPGVENDSNPALEATRREAAALGEVIDSLRGSLEEARRRLKAQVAEIGSMGTAWGEAAKPGTVLADTTDRIGRAMQRATEAVEEAKDPVAQLSERIESGLEQSLLGLVDRTSSVEDAFKNMARTVIAEAYRMSVVQPILNGLLGTRDSSGNRTGGLLGSLIASFGGFRAEGGPISAGRAYMVGERGPEMIVPSSSGTVVPNHAFGGVTVNQTIAVDGGSNPAAIRQELARLMPQITEATKSAVIDARRRGGQMKAAFG